MKTSVKGFMFYVAFVASLGGIAPVGRELPAWAAQTVDIAPYSYTIVVLDE